MPEIRVPLTMGEEVSDDADYRDNLVENYVEVKRDVRGAPAYLTAHPGLTYFTSGIGIDKGGHWNERQHSHYRVSGGQLISVADNGAIDNIGAVSSAGQAVMCHSFLTQSVLIDGRWWLYDGITLTESADPDLGDPISMTWIDGYYFFCSEEYLFHTSILDETDIDPLQFATSEFSPDPSLAVAKTADNQVIVFNRYTTEFFINKATDDFAFQRVSGKAVKCGSVGTHAWVEMTGGFVVLGSGRDESTSVQVIQAGRYNSISTREVDKIIASYSEDPDLSNAVLESRVHDGTEFLLVRLPNHTLLMNYTLGMKRGPNGAWTIIKSGVDDEATTWRGVNGVFHPNVGWVYGDDIGSQIGILDNTVATQYDAEQEYIFYSPLLPIKGANIHSIELDILPGHQKTEEDITVAISTTYDGLTHSIEQWDLYGEQDIYDNRLLVRRLGYVKGFIGFKFRLVTPEQTTFSNMVMAYGS